MMGRTLCILLAVLWLAGCVPAEQTGGGAPVAGTAGRPAPLLLISLDGFRHDYRERAATPHLDRLADGGLVADGLVQAYPTKTFTTHYSLVTGLYTENHGVVSNNMWDPLREARFSLSDRDAVEDLRWYDGEPIWRTAERQGLRAATFFWPGSEAPIGGSHPGRWMRFDASVPHRERIDRVLAWLDLPEAERPDVITLYFGRVDALGHRHGPESRALRRGITDIDRDLGVLLEGLEQRQLLERMHLMVMSDHGMSEIDPDRYIFLDDYLSLADVHVSDWGPAAHIWAGRATAEEVIDALADAHPRLRVWRRGEAPEHYHFREHPRIPDVLAEADHGWMISTRSFRARIADQVNPTRGMHGWDPLHREMHGIFIAHGPAFPAGARMPHLEGVHVYPLMAHLLGIEAAPNDGSLAAFAGRIAAAADVPGPAPRTLPILYGDRLPDAEAAMPLARADLSGPDAVVTFSGALVRDCGAAGCTLLLRDGAAVLELDDAALSLDRTAGRATVAGRLRAGAPPRLEVTSLLLEVEAVNR